MTEEKSSKSNKVKIPRTKMPEQHPGERVKNFNEVELGISEDGAVRESMRCLMCKKPKCIEGCPVEIDIRSFIALVRERKFAEALEKIREKNALPAICGRVCPQEDQCEKVCVLGIKDDPVAIGKLERFVSEIENASNNSGFVKNYTGGVSAGNIDRRNKKSTGKGTNNNSKVAVIGSGPAGLTCAGELAKMGYKVTIFEALHETGGVLIYGIPEFRLPKSIVKKEVEYVKSLGVEMSVNSVIGKTFTIDELINQGYKSIFVGTGAGLPYFMNIPGENLNGVYSANEYLTRVNLMKAYLFPRWDTPIKKANIASVIGGGNVALDSARTAKRLGAENVYLIYRRSEVEMPGRIEEIKHAKEEGIEMIFLTNPVEIIGRDGWVEKIRCIRMELGELDEYGRRRPIPIPGSEFDIVTEIVVMAIGQGPNPLLTQTSPDINVSKRGNIIADSIGKTSKKGVFAGGDIVTGAATVILAMGAGKIAARAMDEYVKTGIW
jgi:glutamate synthase (NADPH/NADH) small chain